FGMDPAFDYKGIKIEVSQSKDKMEWRSNPSLGEKNQFALELDHMATCIYENKEPFTKGEEGLQDQRIMEALYRSAAEGKIIQLEKINRKDPFRGTVPEKES
ncbi:MAG: Gfo/Idh/MocA family oxidoreductase, partial [Bacteroidia bacterium]